MVSFLHDLRYALRGMARNPGLGLGAVGIHAVVSYSVTQRTSEIGIRMALGGQAAGVLRMVLVDGVASLLIGAFLGLSGGFLLAHWTSSGIRAMNPNDPFMYALVSALRGAVAFLATYLLARRVTRVDPLVALRNE